MGASGSVIEGDESQDLLCAKLINSIRTKRSYTFVCAVDGSEASDLAVAASLNLLKKNDFLCVFHAYSEDEELPLHLRPDSIKEKYDVQLVSALPSSRYSFMLHDRGSKSVKDTMALLLNKYADQKHIRPEFLVMGYTGVRGIDKTEGPTTAGSNSDFAMRSIHVPCILIKNPVPKSSRTYIMAVDDTNISKIGLDVLFTLLTPRDKLTVVHVFDSGIDNFNDGNSTYEDFKNYYENELGTHAPTLNVVFKTIMKEGMTSVATHIIDYVNEEDPDFFALAPRLKPERNITSFTAQMIAHTKCNIILCKTPEGIH